MTTTELRRWDGVATRPVPPRPVPRPATYGSGGGGWDGGCRDEPGRRGWAWAVLGLIIASLLLPALVGGYLVAKLLYLPSSGELPPERSPFESRVTRVVDADGTEIGTFRRFETSLAVTPADVPQVLKQAVVAVEDRRFYSHHGVDGHGLSRALFRDVEASDYVQGGSTITQQLVRLAYTGDHRRTLSRKIREAMLARRVETELTKDEILYRYLSRAYFGGGAYGAAAAAQSYFRKPLRDLTLSEAALLAGVIPAPTRFEPRSNPGAAEVQRRVVLDRMLDQGMITSDAHDRAAAQPVMLLEEGAASPESATVVHPFPEEVNRYPYFSDYLRRYLIARYGEDVVYGGGLQVEASIDPRLQAQAEATVAKSLEGTRAPLEMSLVSVEPGTGMVRALVGGRDFTHSSVNLALGNCAAAHDNAAAGRDEPVCVSGGGGGRQPGSAFKPYTLAKALESGKGPDDRYSGPSTFTFPHCTGNGCVVHNVESGGYGRITLRQATTLSVNTVFAQLIDDVGVRDTAELAHRLGMTMVNPDGKLRSGEPYGPGLTLGSVEVSPLDMAAAYGVFAARGMRFPATPVVRVTDASGKVLEDDSTRRGQRVLSSDVADEVNDILSDVVRKGTGRAAALDPQATGTAGKTGTSEEFSDAWFVGYTTELSTAVWLGHSDSRRPLRDINGTKVVYGGTIPAETWKAFMTGALAGSTPEPFTKPLRFVPAPVPATPPPSIAPPPEAPVPEDPVSEDPVSEAPVPEESFDQSPAAVPPPDPFVFVNPPSGPAAEGPA